MVRYHTEVEFDDGSILIFSIEKIENLFNDEMLNVARQKHGSIHSIISVRDYYDSPVGISNQ